MARAEGYTGKKPSSIMTTMTRSDLLQYHRQLSMDADTVNKHLRLSEGNTRLSGTLTEHPYVDHPDRFDGSNLQVLCRESVCGRSYWELEWSGMFGVEVSVSYKSISRKDRGNDCWFGCNYQSWSLSCSPTEVLFRHRDTDTVLPVESISRRLGVYVDHSAGSLSFYSVHRDTVSLIHSIQTVFTQPLYPGFYAFIGSSVKLCDISE